MAKQLKITGTEEFADKELNIAAENYVEQRDKRMRMSEKESDAKQALIDMMKAKNLSIYRDNDTDPPLLVTLTINENVKVQAKDTVLELAEEPNGD